MKIIFLNALGGRLRDNIIDYLKTAAESTDIFCLQETYEPMKSICKDLFIGWQKITSHKPINSEDDFDSSIYVNSNIKVLSSEILLKNFPRIGLGLYSEVLTGDRRIHIGNFHGIAHPGDKLDNQDRIVQSGGLIDFLGNKEGLKIIGGDFNLLPETQSIRMFEENGYIDLIKKFKIPTTRNRLAWELWPNSKQYYSDYVFVSPDVKVKSFSVPNIEISDHLPMELEIEL